MFLLRATAFVVKGSDGKAMGTAAIIKDISERRQVGKAQKASQARYQDLYDNAPDMYVSVHPGKATILTCNQTLATALGYTKQEIVGRPIFDLYHPDCMEDAKRAFQSFVQTGQVKDVELQLKRKDGSKVDVSLNVSAVRDEQGNILASISAWRDITELKQAEEKLHHYQRQLKSLLSELSRAEEAERRRIATELHEEMGQTLALSKIKLGMLHKGSSSTQESALVKEINGLIDQVIKSTSSLTYELSPPVLYDFGLEAALKWLGEQVEEKHGVTCQVQISDNPKPLDHDTSMVLFQSVRELMNNAVAHGKASCVKITLWTADSELGIKVEDDGVGFDTSSDPLLPDPVGGFGLFNIRERLETLGGSFQIESQPKGGTRVRLLVPLKLDKG